MRKYPNLLKNLKVDRPEQAWVSDITYIPSLERIYYLSLVTDVFSRKIVGYHLSTDLRTEGVLTALKMAIKSRKTSLSLLHHSDRGSQYCSAPYQQLLGKHNIRASMTEGIGDCYQNAVAERINGILKDEFLPEYLVKAENIAVIIRESINIYNNQRPHTSLNYQTPSYFHKKQFKKPVNIF
jgi:transposase InsO family protein